MIKKPEQQHLFLLSHAERVYHFDQDLLWFEIERWFLKENVNLSEDRVLPVLATIAARHRIPIIPDSMKKFDAFWIDSSFWFKQYKLKVIPVIIRTGKCTLRGSDVVKPLEEYGHSLQIDDKQIDNYRRQAAA